jgi:hypothetical protein
MTNKNSIWASAIIGVVLLLCVFILKGTIAGFSTNNRLTVTGSSERFVKSDTAKWIITVSKRVNKSEDGPAALEKDLAQVTKILEKNGFTKDQITMGQGGTSQVCALSPQGYESCSVGVVATNFTQSIIVETPDVDKVYIDTIF